MPHDWLDETGGRSTLDLVTLDRPVLFSFGEHVAWRNALGAADVAMVRVGVDTPALESWRTLCAVDEDGALLVRPDHHVAWRAQSSTQLHEVEHALDVLAGKSPRPISSRAPLPSASRLA